MACTSVSTISRSNKESLEDCMCAICLCILIHPVTLPCGHELCMPCFKQTVEEASLSCPLCRTRISTWARKASKAKTLVDQKRWDQIQRLFPQRVQRRLDGLDEETDEELEEKEEISVSYRQMVQLSKPGEIRQEYEAELRRLAQQQEEERQREEEASAALIQRLSSLEEERSLETRRHQEEIVQRDAELAQELDRIINTAESETPVNRLLQDSTDNYPNQLLLRSNSSTPCVTAKDNSEKVKQALFKRNNKTLETFFRRVPADARTSTRCSSEPKPVAGEYEAGKNVVSPKNSACRRSESVPVGNKENLPNLSACSPVALSDDARVYESVVETDTVRRKGSLVSKDSHPSETSEKDCQQTKRAESAISISSGDSDCVIQCDGSSVTNVDVPHFKPIQTSPRSPGAGSRTIPVEPCVVRLTPRVLFSTSCLSSTVFPIVTPPASSSLIQPARQKGTDMGSLMTKFSGGEKSDSPKPCNEINGVGPREGHSSPRRARSTSPPTQKVLPCSRYPSCDDLQRSSFSYSRLKDFRQRNGLHSPIKEVVSDSELTDSSPRHQFSRARPLQNEHSQMLENGRELRVMLGCERTSTDEMLADERRGLKNGDGQSVSSSRSDHDIHPLSSSRESAQGRLTTAGHVRDSSDAAFYHEAASGSQKPPSHKTNSNEVISSHPSTSSKPFASNMVTSSERPDNTKPVGIFNPATVPPWSEALFVDTIQGKGKRLAKKSANSSIRNSPKTTDKIYSRESSEEKEMVSIDTGISGSKAEEDIVPSVEQHKTPQRVRSSSRIVSGKKTESADGDRSPVVNPVSCSPCLHAEDCSDFQNETSQLSSRQASPNSGSKSSVEHSTKILVPPAEDSCDDNQNKVSRRKTCTTAGFNDNETDTEDRLVRRVRRQVRGETKSAQDCAQSAESVTKSHKKDKCLTKNAKPVETEKKSQASLSNQRSIRDWFSPQQSRNHRKMNTSGKAPTVDSSSSPSSKRKVVLRKETDVSEASSTASSAATSPDKLGIQASHRIRKVNPRLDAYLVSSKLQQLQASPSKSSDRLSSSPCRSAAFEATPSKAQKRRVSETSNENSPAKFRRLTPSKVGGERMDSDSCSVQESYYSSEEEDEEGLCQEEKDLRLAMRLQRQFDLADKFNLNIVRFKGTDDQYSLRATRSNRKK